MNRWQWQRRRWQAERLPPRVSPGHPERYAISFFSERWRREMARLWISGNNGANFSNMGPGTEWDNAELRAELRLLDIDATAARRIRQLRQSGATDRSRSCSRKRRR